MEAAPPIWNFEAELNVASPIHFSVITTGIVFRSDSNDGTRKITTAATGLVIGSDSDDGA